MSETNESDEKKVPSLEVIEAELKREKHRHVFNRTLKSTIYAAVIIAAAAVVIAVLLLPVLQITGSSMEETLQSGDLVIAWKGSGYKAGDVVAFYYNNTILVKRVIATAGDWVDIDEDGNVSVNGEPLEEPYVSEKALGDCNIEFPYQVPEGSNFLMGDRRATSVDSRNASVGSVGDDVILGKILFCVWPFADFGIVK